MPATEAAADPELSSNTQSSTPLVSRSATHAHYDLQIAISKEYFFLTIPGIIRLLELLIAGLNLGTFGYYCTYYDRVLDEVFTPFFLSSTREEFFFIANCNTFLTSLYIIFSSVICFRSHAALMGSLFMFIFDFAQFLLVVAGSIGLILLYMEVEAKTVYGTSLQARQGLAVTGMLLACLHLIGCIYDLGIYIRQTNSLIQNLDPLLSPTAVRQLPSGLPLISHRPRNS